MRLIMVKQARAAKLQMFDARKLYASMRSAR
jgi:hypothetical protein